MKKVWWVESGEYSDYSVDGVFSSEENAELYSKQFGGNVQEVELDVAIDLLKRGYKPFSVSMERTGRARVVSGHSESPEKVKIKINKPYRGGTGILWRSYIYGDGWFKSAEHAVKVFNERRAELIATGEWEPDPEGAQSLGGHDSL